MKEFARAFLHLDKKGQSRFSSLLFTFWTLFSVNDFFSRWQEKSEYFSVHLVQTRWSKTSEERFILPEKNSPVFSHQEKLSPENVFIVYWFDLNIVWKVCETGWIYDFFCLFMFQTKWNKDISRWLFYVWHKKEKKVSCVIWQVCVFKCSLCIYELRKKCHNNLWILLCLKHGTFFEDIIFNNPWRKLFFNQFLKSKPYKRKLFKPHLENKSPEKNASGSSELL